MKRLGIALAIAAAIYGVAIGAGALLYATGAIATGATHNDCVGIKQKLATQLGIAEEDVPQAEISRATSACLDTHELTKGEAFRSEYLFWAAWPGFVCAARAWMSRPTSFDPVNAINRV